MNPKLIELQLKAGEKLAELKGITNKSELTQEDVLKAEGLKSDLQGIKGEIEGLNKIDGLKSAAGEYDSWLNDPAFKMPGMGQQGNAGLLGFQGAGAAQINNTKAGPEIEQYGAGLLTEKQIKAVYSSEYKGAFESYLRKGEKGLTSAEVKVLQEGIDDQGGYFVTPDFLMRVIQKKPTPTRLVNFVTQLNTSRDRVQIPRVVYATDDLYTTGIRVTWTGEVPASATTHRVTEPVFGQMGVNIYTAMLSMPLTNNLVEDAAFDLEGWSAGKFAETIDLLKDNMILNGSGVDQPAGVLQNPNGTNEPATVNSGAAADITADWFMDMAYAVPEQYDESCRWVFNKTNTGKAIAKLKDGDGRYLFNAGPGRDGVASARPVDLVGYPYSYSGFAPNIGANTYPVAFGDWLGYYLLNRIGLSVQVLRELYAETNQLLLLGRVRFGGDVAEDWRLKIGKVSA